MVTALSVVGKEPVQGVMVQRLWMAQNAKSVMGMVVVHAVLVVVDNVFTVMEQES